MLEAQSPFGLSELVSGQAGPALAPAEWTFGPTGRLLGLAGLRGWAGSGGRVSGSWGSVSLSLVQTGSL